MLASGWLLLLAGFAMLLHVSLAPFLKVPLIVLWIVDCGRQIARQGSGYAAVRALRIVGPGCCDIRAAGGETVRCELLEASVMTRGFCWLCLRHPSGRCHGEWLTVTTTGAERWRRLQIAWRWGPPSSD